MGISNDDFKVVGYVVKHDNQTDEQELEEFDEYETKDILFRKFKELSTRKFETEENYLESCRIMDNIAMTLLETE